MTGPAMAHLTPVEFTEAVTVLAAHYGVERLRDRFARLNAFTSRRGLNSADAIADRLHLLTGGLRRQVPATYAFSTLWNEMLNARVSEEAGKQLETLVDQVNACLTEREDVAPGKEEALDQALAAYRDALATSAGPEIARLDMLLKAVPAVAERLRDAPATAAGESGSQGGGPSE